MFFLKICQKKLYSYLLEWTFFTVLYIVGDIFVLKHSSQHVVGWQFFCYRPCHNMIWKIQLIYVPKKHTSFHVSITSSTLCSTGVHKQLLDRLDITKKNIFCYVQEGVSLKTLRLYNITRRSCIVGDAGFEPGTSCVITSHTV